MSDDPLKVRGSAQRAKESFDADKQRRENAQRILNRSEVIGEYDLARELMTTLGGGDGVSHLRPLTHADLAEFRRRVKALEDRSIDKRMQGGIRAQQVMQFSRDEDIKRANQQIHRAVLAGGSNGKLRFITNASGDTPTIKNHYVNVELLSYGAATSPSTKKDVMQMVRWLVKEPLRFECDCGKFQFWLRYIATIGGWAAGRQETGYPKIRNPELTGIACKHVLRVMRELSTSSALHNQIKRMLEHSVGRLNVKQAEADKIQKKQQRQAKVINKNAAARAAERLLKKIHQEAIAREMAEAEQRKNAATNSELFNQRVRALQHALTMGAIEQKTFDSEMKRLRKKHNVN